MRRRGRGGCSQVCSQPQQLLGCPRTIRLLLQIIADGIDAFLASLSIAEPVRVSSALDQPGSSSQILSDFNGKSLTLSNGN